MGCAGSKKEPPVREALHRTSRRESLGSAIVTDIPLTNLKSAVITATNNCSTSLQFYSHIIQAVTSAIVNTSINLMMKDAIDKYLLTVFNEPAIMLGGPSAVSPLHYDIMFLQQYNVIMTVYKNLFVKTGRSIMLVRKVRRIIRQCNPSKYSVYDWLPCLDTCYNVALCNKDSRNESVIVFLRDIAGPHLYNMQAIAFDIDYLGDTLRAFIICCLVCNPDNYILYKNCTLANSCHRYRAEQRPPPQLQDITQQILHEIDVGGYVAPDSEEIFENYLDSLRIRLRAHDVEASEYLAVTIKQLLDIIAANFQPLTREQKRRLAKTCSFDRLSTMIGCEAIRARLDSICN